jgi:DNA segregation ATPase FtsK/SpoIIIE, S-DNA-T family
MKQQGAGSDGRLQLRVTVGNGAESTDVEVSAASGHTVGELAGLLAERQEWRGSSGLWCERRRRYLERDIPLGQSGIHWGDRLLLASSAPEPTCLGGAARMELLVTGGPSAGRVFALGDGDFRLGRDPACDICLPDPSLSRHHLDVRVDEGGIRVADAGSSNGTALNGEALRANEPCAMDENDEIELGRTLLRARPASTSGPDPGLRERDGRVDFNRPPRVKPPVVPFEKDLAAPPSSGRKARLPLAASLIPVGAGLLLFLLLKSPVMLAMAALSPMMAISTFISDRRGGKRSFARESADFRSALAKALEELDGALADEAVVRRGESPDAPELLARLRGLTPAVWERRPADEDFLRLRVGVADLAPRSALRIQDGGDADLRAEADARLVERQSIPSVPLTLDLLHAGVAGLAGGRAAVDGLARWLVAQAAILHSPGELVIMAALTPASVKDWDWLKWLPHQRPDRVGLESGAVAVGRADTENLLAEIRDLTAQRRARTRALSSSASKQAHLLLLIDEETDVDRALLSAALSPGADNGVTALWIGKDARDLPGQTSAIVEVAADRSVLSLTDVASGQSTGDASAEGLSVELAEEIARMLCPIRDISELARAGDIPRRVGLLDLIGLLPPSAQALQQRWSRWRGELRATVGVGADGPLTLDLRDEGPHALIAGTTGSGKSELLRTLVAGAAAAAPPDRLSFLLVDYKGGAAFAPCAALPHVVDIVSDLDEHLAERALISLNAELKRRERILAENGAKDLLELMRRDAPAAPPLLVIAVDEFAKLREEVPEFVDGVVDIAQRGRSLGVHMVLAAQTLRNAFTPAIRANTNLRLALRVSEESESEDMIASPLAARIPSGEGSRGRALVRTGHGELREFQAAYVSGRSRSNESDEIAIESYELDGAPPHREARPAGGDSDADSDLIALGEAAREAQAQLGLRAPAPPWLPTLPALLSLDELDVREPHQPGAAIGLIDLPDLQRQDPLRLDLEAVGHVAVFGAGNSGKTTALTSAALALARTTSSDELCIYCLDAASGKLRALEQLPHCAGVVAAEEEERVQRLLGVLLRRIERRDPGSSGPAGGPRTMVLLLDDLGAFAHHYDRPGFDSPYEQLQRILAGGRAAGVHVILSASRRGALPAALGAHIGQRLVLRMPSEEEMLSLGLDSKTIRGARLGAGRGFTQDSREFQVAVPVSAGEKGDVALAARSVAGERSSSAPRIEVLPTEFSRESLGSPGGIDRLPLGIADEDLETATVDLADMHLLVVGPYRSGRSTAIATLARAVSQACPEAHLHLMAPRRSPLREIELWTHVATSAEACEEHAASLHAELQAQGPDGERRFLFIDDGGELNGAKIVTDLERLIRLARDASWRVIAAVETSAARGIGNGWIRELRREGHGLLLQPDLAADGDLLGARLPRRVAAPLVPGRGFLVTRGSAELLQVAC